jgi:hypothetical protein
MTCFGPLSEVFNELTEDSTAEGVILMPTDVEAAAAAETQV